MYSPDLIQRIFHQKEKGDDTNYLKVFRDLRNIKADFEFDFETENIYWTCFESKKYIDIIDEMDEKIYFYLFTIDRSFEIIIPGYSYPGELSKVLFDRKSFFHTIWVIGAFFPGLENVNKRPLKIIQQYVGLMDNRPVSKLNYWLKKMLTEYKLRRKPIFEVVDYHKAGEEQKNWKKIVDRKKQ